MLDLRHLRHALALAELGHYARAAKACHISQPAMTRSIQALEHALGVPLFDRNRDGVQPTEFGRLLLRRAVDMDIAAREIEREIKLARGLDIGTLAIGAGPFGGAALVGPVVAQLNRRHPQLRIEIVVAPWRELPAHVRSRKVDVVVAELTDLAELADFESMPLRIHPLQVVCRPGHPLTQLKKPTATDLFRYPMAGPVLPEAAEKHILNIAPPALRQQLKERGAMTIQCDSSALLKSIVMQSDAISMMNRFMIERELAQGELVALNNLDLGMQTRYGAAWFAGRTVSSAMAVFLELLRAEDA